MVVKTTPPAFTESLPAQIGPALRLGRRLAQDIPAAGEDAEELVVEVVAVGEDDDGGVFHGEVAGDGPGVEGHGEALPRALGMPHDADAAVAGLAARPSARLVAPALLGDGRLSALQLGRAQRLGDGDPHRVELVVAGDLLGQRSAAVVLEHDEVAEQSEEPRRVADALQHHLKLGHVGTGQRFCPPMVRHGLNHSIPAVSEPTRACVPSEMISSSFMANSDGTSAL